MKFLCKGFEADFTLDRSDLIEQQGCPEFISDSKDHLILKLSRHLATFAKVGMQHLFKHVLGIYAFVLSCGTVFHYRYEIQCMAQTKATYWADMEIFSVQVWFFVIIKILCLLPLVKSISITLCCEVCSIRSFLSLPQQGQGAVTSLHSWNSAPPHSTPTRSLSSLPHGTLNIMSTVESGWDSVLFYMCARACRWCLLHSQEHHLHRYR